MSSEVSNLETDDDKKKLAHQGRIALELGTSIDRMADEVVWETVRPAWRAKEVRSKFALVPEDITCLFIDLHNL